MLSIRSATLLFALLTTPTSTFAFQASFAASTRDSIPCKTTLNMAINNNDNGDDALATATSSRRAFVQNVLGITAAAVVASSPQPANAKYSDYSRREKDWQERLDKGEVKISSARDLRRQLSEIAPMNDEGSKIFCPNGPSAAVSPLMENKCGDRMAIPSVYGRSQDTVGNSIPGFSSTYLSGTSGSSGTAGADTGGFPTYQSTTSGKR